VGVARGALAALGKVGIVLAIAVAFLFGMVGTVYLSLRTAEVKVPDLSGKDRFTAESQLQDIGLKIRVRGTRPSTEKKPDTILNQLPEAGLIVKEGIEVAVEVTRAPKEGESVPSSAEETAAQEEAKPADNSNTQAANTNQNGNQNKPPKNKNTNKNTNKNANNTNSNNSNNANRNANNRNANNRNANRNTNNANRGTTNTTPTPNRNSSNPNANRRAPVTTTPPLNPGANRTTP
jgi:hypothetical protein